jgi:hypothetical protein
MDMDGEHGKDSFADSDNAADCVCPSCYRATKLPQSAPRLDPWDVRRTMGDAPAA